MEATVNDILYEHNIETYENAMRMIERHGKVAVVQPTGSGKTYIAMAIMSNYRNCKKLVLGPSRAFLDITSKNAFWDKENVICITYQYLSQHRNELDIVLKNLIGEPESIGLIVVDELHRVGAPYWNTAVNDVISMCKNADIVGLTATPIRYDEDRNMVDELFSGYSVGNMSLSTAISSNIFSKLKYVVGVKNANREISKLIKRFSKHEYIIKQFREQLNQIKIKWDTEKSFIFTLGSYIGCPDEYKPGLESRHLVFVPSIEQISKYRHKIGEWFSEVYKGYTVEIYDVNSKNSRKDNLEYLNRFSDTLTKDTIRVMISVQMLSESFHFDSIDSISMFRGTESINVFIQQIGRGISAGKEAPYIFDFVDNFDNIGIEALTAGEKQNSDGGKCFIFENMFSEFDNMTTECVEDIQRVENKIINRIKLLTVSLWRTARKLGYLQAIPDEQYRNWAIQQYRAFRNVDGSIIKQHIDAFDTTEFIDSACGFDWYKQYENRGTLHGDELEAFKTKAKELELRNSLGSVKTELESEGLLKFSSNYDLSSLKNKLNTSLVSHVALIKLIDKINNKESKFSCHMAYLKAASFFSKCDTHRKMNTASIDTLVEARVWQIINEDTRYNWVRQLDLDNTYKLMQKAMSAFKQRRSYNVKLGKPEMEAIDNIVAEHERCGDNQLLTDMIDYYECGTTQRFMRCIDFGYGLSATIETLKSYITTAMKSDLDKAKLTDTIKNYANKVNELISDKFSSSYMLELINSFRLEQQFYVSYLTGDTTFGDTDKATKFVKEQQESKQEAERVLKEREEHSKEIVLTYNFMASTLRNNNIQYTNENIVDKYTELVLRLVHDNLPNLKKVDKTSEKLKMMCKYTILGYEFGSLGIPEFLVVFNKLASKEIREQIVMTMLSHKSRKCHWDLQKAAQESYGMQIPELNRQQAMELVQDYIKYRATLSRSDGDSIYKVIGKGDIDMFSSLLIDSRFIEDTDLYYTMMIVYRFGQHNPEL